MITPFVQKWQRVLGNIMDSIVGVTVMITTYLALKTNQTTNYTTSKGWDGQISIQQQPDYRRRRRWSWSRRPWWPLHWLATTTQMNKLRMTRPDWQRYPLTCSYRLPTRVWLATSIALVGHAMKVNRRVLIWVLLGTNIVLVRHAGI